MHSIKRNLLTSVISILILLASIAPMTSELLVSTLEIEKSITSIELEMDNETESEKDSEKELEDTKDKFPASDLQYSLNIKKNNKINNTPLNCHNHPSRTVFLPPPEQFL